MTEVYYDKNKVAQLHSRLYKQSLDVSLIDYVQEYTLQNKLGDLSGKSILDLGCGEGYSSRNLHQAGAAKVVGVDISAKMVEVAKQIEVENPLGIEYMVGDVTQLGKIGSFDLVTAYFVLNCCQTKEQLLQMCQTVTANLKPGGRFICINNNVQQSPDSYHICPKYGYQKSIDEPLKEGTPIKMTFPTDEGELILYDYHLSRETYDWAFKTAGFREVNYHQWLISPAGLQKFGEEFWQDLLEYQPNVYIECVK